MTLGAAPDQNYGEVFTRRWVVEVLLDLTEYTSDRDLGARRLVEPSCGSGAFLGPVVSRLLTSAKSHNRDFASLGGAIRAYDLQPEHVEASRELCRNLLTAAGAHTSEAKNLVEEWISHSDFLLAESDGTEANVVVGNPPYIRYDDLPDQLAAQYRSTWPTMRGRGDIYVGFFERSLRMLSPEGKVGFICADRWMRNQYGADLRKLVAKDYGVEHIWVMHDVDAFERQVSAYPAITVLGRHEQGSVVVADTTSEFCETSAFALAKASQDTNLNEFADLGVKAHRLPHWFGGDELWPTGSPARLALIEHLNDHFQPLHDPRTGTKVSIGIATGADKAYVIKDPSLVEPERVLPLAMRRDLMSGTFEWQGNYLVNPWNADGSLVSLADYPRMGAHLARQPGIRHRFVAQKDPASWYRTIDKVQSSLINKKKLLLQDMKTTIHPVLEQGGHYPHHNLYYVISDSWDMEVLGGILLSRIAQAFIEAYCVRMRGGTLRFQAQYLKLIRVPNSDKIDAGTQEALRTAFRTRDVEAATRAAAKAYGIALKDYELMTVDTDDTTEPSKTAHKFDAAIESFWKERERQAKEQKDKGKKDTGTRGTTTGGQHLNALQELVASQFADLSLSGATVLYKGKNTLPGYFRKAKNWDIVVTWNDILVAAIECKSQVGSVGNNFNNRAEEMLGNAVDLRYAFEEDLLGPIEPWIGYIFVFEHEEDKVDPKKRKSTTKRPHALETAFDNLSTHTEQYRLMFQRLVDKKIYDAMCLITTRRGEGVHSEPVQEMSTEHFAAAVEDRITKIKDYVRANPAGFKQADTPLSLFALQQDPQD
ncbi:PaeR7I family type II restriction endonuclease [Lentzea sp. NPDC058450]|uniref:PaeR7I family type II restriction endonuclease n=1 Tax=Lentzea sp. NPDC058450 TaxID=3346505 RepID=UPI003653C4F4